MTNPDLLESDNKGEIVLYQPEGEVRLEVRVENDTVWLSANQMALLFDRDEKTLRKHINNVFLEEVEKENNTHFLRVDGFNFLQVVIYFSTTISSAAPWPGSGLKIFTFVWVAGPPKAFISHTNR